MPVEYVVFYDEGHGFTKKKNQIEGYGKILAILDRYLKCDIEQLSGNVVKHSTIRYLVVS